MKVFRNNCPQSPICCWKRAVFSLFFLTCALVLSACGERQLPPEEEYPLPPEPKEGVLIYAALNPVSSKTERSVAFFNEKHEDVRIEIRDYSDEGGVDRLLTELTLGWVPDIMEMHRFGKDGPLHKIVFPGSYEAPADEYWMPYRQMDRKGYLEDLWPWIENDPKLGREAVLEPLLQAAEVDGRLPILFSSVGIFTLSGRESVVGNRYSWTLDDIMEVLATMPEGSTIMRYNMTKRDAYFNLLRFSMEQFVDRSTGECSFDSQNFRELVAFLEEFPDEVDPEKAQDAEEDIRANIRYGRQMLEGALVIWPQTIGYMDTIWQERAAFPGFPTADGSSGSFFYPIENKLAMSSVCRNKEAAWEYIRNLITPIVIPSDIPDGRVWIAVNQSNYKKNLRNDVKQVERFYQEDGNRGLEIFSERYFTYGEEVHLTRLLTEEDIQRIDDLVHRTTLLYWPDDDLTDIVWETLGAYFAGDRTLDDTIGLLQNRMGLYLNEQK